MTRSDIYDREKALVHIVKHKLKANQLEVWTTKFRMLRNKAPSRGLECHLTLSQYVRLAIKAGLTCPSEIGVKPDQYQMARIGDVGNYVWGNCRFITQAQNIVERKENGGDEAQARKLSKLWKGCTKETNPGVKAAAEKLSKSFILVSPSGKKFKGNNLTEFAKKHHLTRSNLSLVCRGVASHSKGWTGRYI